MKALYTRVLDAFELSDGVTMDLMTAVDLGEQRGRHRCTTCDRTRATLRGEHARQDHDVIVNASTSLLDSGDGASGRRHRDAGLDPGKTSALTHKSQISPIATEQAGVGHHRGAPGDVGLCHHRGRRWRRGRA